jgi:hypothetical protein
MALKSLMEQFPLMEKQAGDCSWNVDVDYALENDKSEAPAAGIDGFDELMETYCHTRFLRPKPDAHRMYAHDQVVIHTVRM